MKKRKDIYLNCSPYICYEETIQEVFKNTMADTKDIVFMQSKGSGVVIKDFWNYYYKIINITINEVYEKLENKNDFLLVGENVIVNMRYIDTITSNFIQVSEHLIPIDENIKENLYSYQAMVYKTKERYDKICDTAEESSYNNSEEDWEEEKWGQRGRDLYDYWGST
jgi:hypothetical protein